MRSGEDSSESGFWIDGDSWAFLLFCYFRVIFANLRYEIGLR